jgi:hypothetical protein
MNLWGFQPPMWEILTKAMVEATNRSDESEVLLPTTVGDALSRDDVTVRVIEVNAHCIGVTHASDLPIVQQAVRDLVARGERPVEPFS